MSAKATVKRYLTRLREIPRMTVKRYLMFLLGVLVCATGIAFITRAALGTSPISSTPFVLSLITPPSMGVYTFLFNMLFLVGEAVLLKRFTWKQVLQIAATFIFSLCIDGALALIPTQLHGPLPMKLLYLAIGCPVMALGISLEIFGGVIMLPGEGFVKALAEKLRVEFGNMKVIFDSSLTAIAAVIALLAFGRLNGVGFGTLVSALLVGQIVKFYTRRLGFIKKVFEEKPRPSSGELRPYRQRTRRNIRTAAFSAVICLFQGFPVTLHVRRDGP